MFASWLHSQVAAKGEQKHIYTTFIWDSRKFEDMPINKHLPLAECSGEFTVSMISFFALS